MIVKSSIEVSKERQMAFMGDQVRRVKVLNQINRS